jgi:DNA-binding GntR family transcriptional regulator
VQSQHEDTAAAAMKHHLQETRSRILKIHTREEQP